MKIVYIFLFLIAFFYFVDSCLDASFLESEKVIPQCNIFEDPNNCIYCFNSNETQVTFKFTTLEVPVIQLFYQYLKQDYNCTDLLVSTDKAHFPFGMTNEHFTNEMKDTNAFNILKWELKKKCSSSICNVYVETEYQIKAFAYAIFASDGPEISAYYKNNLKYLEDSFVTFLCFVMLLIGIKMIPEQESNHPLYKYINENQPHLLLIIVLLAQPLRPLCFLEEFESIEWLIGQGSYAFGECYFLIYLLQIMSFLKGGNANSNKWRNAVFSIIAIMPISFDRLLIAFSSHTRVIINLSEQIDGIDLLMQICWVSFILYCGLIGYELLQLLQSKERKDLMIVDFIFFVIYAVQKSHFYLYYESYSHHLFNPINMLMMVAYVVIILTLDFEKEKVKDKQEDDIEMEDKHLHSEEEDEEHEIEEGNQNLEQQIADYYRDQKDVLI